MRQQLYNENAFDEIDWWKYRQLTTDHFNAFESIIPLCNHGRKMLFSMEMKLMIVLIRTEKSRAVERFLLDKI